MACTDQLFTELLPTSEFYEFQLLYSFLKGVFIPYGKYRVTVTESGVQLLAQKPVQREGWRKGMFALFWMLAGRGRADSCPKVGSPSPPLPWPPPAIRGYEVLLLEGEVTWRNSTVSSDSHLEIGHRLTDQHQ